ncbi:HMG box-containing protein [Ceratobasidium theobromae]|uniref:HMG box-containing protein n=1 Tax=Ceratobasidium theobromae TaxID=1582974 RepID=A0A5N5QWS9_9AGAM|nr:HMG box-containing protein [Ceratobasidium theobromae]
MPREVTISSTPEETSYSEEHGVISRLGTYRGINDSPPPRRAHGTSYRNRIIVISDSDSDSDLPPPSSLLQGRKPITPTVNFESQDLSDEIIDISSGSEVEATPTKPRTEERLPTSGVAGTYACPVTGTSDSVTSVSPLSTTFKHAISLNHDNILKVTDSPANPRTTAATTPRQPTKSSSCTDSEDFGEDRLFDEGASHPGILHFDPGPRKPAAIASGSAGSISTLGTSDGLCDREKRGGPSANKISDTANPGKVPSNDPFGPVGTLDMSIKSPKPNGTTGNVKTSGSAGGYRGRIKGSINEESVHPETPRPKPKGKARTATLAISSSPVSLSPKPTARNRAKVLEASAISLFLELNDLVFDGRLPKGCPIEWSKKLNTTAGRAHWKRVRDPHGNVIRHDARIELSTKVVDCEERVRNTLSHEMCHLAAWVIDSEIKPPHGPAFKRWSDRIMEARPDITISCAALVEGSSFHYSQLPLDGTHFKARYLRAYMSDLRSFYAANPDMQHGEVMKRLGEMFRAEKEAGVDEELGQVMAGMTRLAIKPNVD